MTILAATACSGAPAYPQDDYLLEVTREWGRDAGLGDLLEQRIGWQDRELRLWDGYGLSGTFGLVIRNRSGQWEGWRVMVEGCYAVLPRELMDTASQATTDRYKAIAPRYCLQDDNPSANGILIPLDTVELVRIDPSNLEAAWDSAVAAGALDLPMYVEPRMEQLDGQTLVLETLYRGRYRASIIECLDVPESQTDDRMNDIAAALGRTVPARIGCYGRRAGNWR